MAFNKAGYLVVAVAAVVAAMPPESPAPAAFRNTDLQQEETKGLAQYGSRGAYPNPESSNFPVTSDPSYSERQQDFPLQGGSVQDLGQRFETQQDASYGPVQGNSAQSEFRQNANIEQRNYRDQSLDNQQTQFQNQNYGPNTYEDPSQRNIDRLNQNLNQDLPGTQQYNQRQGNREQFVGQRSELSQQNVATESFSSGSFQNQRIENQQRNQNQFSDISSSGARGPGAAPTNVENTVNQEFQRSDSRYRGSQRFDDSLNAQDDPNVGNYQYSYDIRSEDTGDMKYHKESRDGNKVIGEYRVKEADGSMRIVKYTADAENGFQATVEYVMEDEEPVEFGAKMVPKTTRPKNQRNFGNRRVFEPARNTLASRDQERPENLPRSEKADGMSLFLNSPASEGQVRPRPGFVGDNRNFQTQRFDESFQGSPEYQQDSREFSSNNQGSEFHEQNNNERQFSQGNVRSQSQTLDESSLQGQSRRPLPFQGRDRQQFQDRNQFQTQNNDRFNNQNRNQERYNYENQEREQYQNQNREQFQNENRNQFQGEGQLQSQERYQFDNQEQNQFPSDNREQFSTQNRNRFQNQNINNFQNNEREQRREDQFQAQNINTNQRQGLNTFQNQRQNAFQGQTQHQGRNTFNEQERLSSQFQENSFQTQERPNPLNNDKNTFRAQYPNEDSNQFQQQQQRNQYNSQENAQYSNNFQAQVNEQLSSQRRIQTQGQVRQHLTTQGGNQFQNPAENRPIQQYNERLQTQRNEFEDFSENQYSRERVENFPSQGQNQFQNQNRRPVKTGREQFRDSSLSGSQNQFNEQNLAQFAGQNRLQYQKQKSNVDGLQSSQETDSQGQRYGVDSQDDHFQGEGVYHAMNDKRYESQRYGQNIRQQGSSTLNQVATFAERDDLANTGLRNIDDNEFVGISRENENYQREEQFSRNQQTQGRLSPIPNSPVNEFQGQRHSAGLVGQQSTNFNNDLTRTVSSQRFQNDNFSQTSSQGTHQGQRFGLQQSQESFRSAQVSGGIPQAPVRHQRFETIAEPHPQA